MYYIYIDIKLYFYNHNCKYNPSKGFKFFKEYNPYMVDNYNL